MNAFKRVQYEARVISLLEEYLGEENISLTSDFDYLGFDSLDSVEVILLLEEEFGIKIDDDELDNPHMTVKDIVSLVESKITA